MNHKIKRQLTQILEICIQKQLNYSLSPEVFNVSVWNKGHSFAGEAYYHGELYDNKIITNERLFTLSDLLKKVKQL